MLLKKQKITPDHHSDHTKKLQRERGAINLCDRASHPGDGPDPTLKKPFDSDPEKNWIRISPNKYVILIFVEKFNLFKAFVLHVSPHDLIFFQRRLFSNFFSINIERKIHETVKHQVGPGSGLWSKSETEPFFPK